MEPELSSSGARFEMRGNDFRHEMSTDEVQESSCRRVDARTIPQRRPHELDGGGCSQELEVSEGPNIPVVEPISHNSDV